MGRYADFVDVVARYKTFGDITTEDAAETDYIRFAEAYLDAQLSGYFTVPFSADNLTAKDLTIEIAFVRTQQFRDVKKADAMWRAINKTLDDLRSGAMGMLTETGETINQDAPSGAWSETMDYAPTFGAGDIVDFEVDGDRLTDEAAERS